MDFESGRQAKVCSFMMLNSKNKLDISKCRLLRPYENREYLGRLLWAVCTPVFRYSPRLFFGWRGLLLRAFGAKIGVHVHIYPTAKIHLPWNLAVGDYSSIGDEAVIYNLGYISIGSSVTISQKTYLCAGTHDYKNLAMPLLRLPISIGDQSWVCATAFIGPGIKIGTGAIVAAGSVVVQDVADWNIVGGNPAKFIGNRLSDDVIV